MTAPKNPRTGKRGPGGNVREEILLAAERLLSRPGPQSEATLRAVAREAGIAAPSIYHHFVDRDAILNTVVARSFTQLAATCAAAASAAEPGLDEVKAIADAYLRFAAEQPGRYRLLFERESTNIADPPHRYEEGLRAFSLLVTALEHVRPDAIPSRTDHMVTAQALIAGLHGIATLRPALPAFPWVDRATLVNTLIDSLTLR